MSQTAAIDETATEFATETAAPNTVEATAQAEIDVVEETLAYDIMLVQSAVY